MLRKAETDRLEAMRKAEEEDKKRHDAEEAAQLEKLRREEETEELKRIAEAARLKA